MGDRMAHLNKAIQMLCKQIGTIKRKSSFYETEAWGLTDQPAFINAVLVIQTALPPLFLLKKLLAIEKWMGRKREQKWGPRIIDLDILYYNSNMFQHTDLCVPHPGLPVRRFTLMPLCEVIPGFVHPFFKVSNRTLLQLCPDKKEVKKIS